MKKYLIPLLMLIIISLLLIVVLLQTNKEEITYKIDKTFTKITTNYINNKKYSISTETYVIREGIITHTKEIIYENNKQPTKVSITESYEESSNKIILQNKTIYVQEDKLCFDSVCKKTFTNEELDNYIEEFNYEDNLIEISNIENYINNKDLTIIVISSSTCSSCIAYKEVLINSLNDYNINYYILDLNKVSNTYKKQILEEYNISGTPTTLVYKKGELLTKEIGYKDLESLEKILFRNEAKSR